MEVNLENKLEIKYSMKFPIENTKYNDKFQEI